MSNKKKQKTLTIEDNGVKHRSSTINKLLWVSAVMLIVLAGIGNIYLEQKLDLAVRVVMMVVLGALGVVAGFMTEQGARALVFLKGSRRELRQVIWPTRQEAMQTTFIVIVIVAIVSLSLWLIDGIIVAIINFLTNVRW